MTNSPAPKRALTFWDHAAILLKWRRLVLIYLLLMAVGAVSYALLAEQWYRSQAQLLPPPSGGMGMGSILPSLASGALGLAGLMSDETNIILSILESRALADTTINRFNWMEREDFPNREEAYERFDEVVRNEFDDRGMITISVDETSPELAQETVNFIVRYARAKFNEVTGTQAGTQKDIFQRRLEQSYEDLATAEQALKDFQNETGMLVPDEQIRVSVEALSRVYTELAMAEVALEVAEATLPSSSSQVVSARTQVKALKEELTQLRKAQGKDDVDLFVSMESAPNNAVTYMRLMREIELQSTILEFLLPQYEQARIVEMREQSNIYVLDWGNLPDKRFRPRRALVVIAWLFAAFILLYPVLLFLEWLERLQVEDPDRHRYVSGTLQQLRPKEFFGRSTPPKQPGDPR